MYVHCGINLFSIVWQGQRKTPNQQWHCLVSNYHSISHSAGDRSQSFAPQIKPHKIKDSPTSTSNGLLPNRGIISIFYAFPGGKVVVSLEILIAHDGYAYFRHHHMTFINIFKATQKHVYESYNMIFISLKIYYMNACTNHMNIII